MADLYGVAPSPTAEPEEISAFLLNQFFQNSSSASGSCHPLNSKYIHSLSPAVPDSFPPEGSGPEAAGIGGSRRLGESERRARDGSSGVNISDPGAYYTARAKDRGDSAFFSVGDVSGESEKALELSDARSNSERPRASSKRSRAAEVHNMSEKRRRSRINEKMKALQNLIPNSNKTDKASMLDEAIDYLKQLQLQVQMLTMRNGLGLYPVCIPGVLQPMQLPPTGMAYDEGNDFFSAGTGAGTLSANEDSPVHPPYDLANRCSISNQNVGVPSGPSISNLEASFGFEASASAHYGSFSQSTPSKDACKEYSTDVKMERNRHAARTNPSSGVS